ncbi:MAG: RdgB/HAM1 family non-canonical purine NTP pyrophosphatase [Steroidobacteraceae bacterium]
MIRVVLATANRGKQRELAALFAPLGLELVLAADLDIGSPEETGATFEANALLKARHASRLATLPALADDSGLQVDALGGRPGVYSARYAGPAASDLDNNARLLAELADLPAPRRTARYRCVLALARRADDPAPLLAGGSWEGRIAFAPAGTGGFGYDPLFIPEGCQQSVAELPGVFKQQHSHRARAAAGLAAQLRAGAL